MTDSALHQIKIQSAMGPTLNVQPVLHEIRHALRNLLENGETHIIDLRSIPLAPGEEDRILESLGHGELHARLDALGPSEIIETQYAGVWLVTHYNQSDSIIGRFIEITVLPDILKSQRQDMLHALERLNTDLHVETDR